MKRLSMFMLIWIVTWKVLVVDEGTKVVRHRSARFQDKSTAEKFIASQASSGRHYTLTHK